MCVFTKNGIPLYMLFCNQFFLCVLMLCEHFFMTNCRSTSLFLKTVMVFCYMDMAYYTYPVQLFRDSGFFLIFHCCERDMMIIHIT